MKYKTKTGGDVWIPGVGLTVDGVIETDQIIENPNMELVEETVATVEHPVAPSPAAVVGTVQPSLNAVTEATLVNPQENKES